ncbi:MAG: autotransporter-associated beta strand repeat-containing protein [Pirellulales bacterium]
MEPPATHSLEIPFGLSQGGLEAADGLSATIGTQLSVSTELKKTGAGTITLTANNTGLTGGSKIEAGTLQVNHNGALGAGTITLAGGKLQAGNGARTLTNTITATALTTSEVVSPTNNNLTLNGNLTGVGTIWKTGAYSVYLGGDNSAFAGVFSNRQSNLFFNTANSGSCAGRVGQHGGQSIRDELRDQRYDSIWFVWRHDRHAPWRL